jgi:phosphohistidine phosphatase
MDLILWRHAEAVETAPGGDDLQRPLSAKGERQAQRMAQWLNQTLPATTRILVSPALRTQQTAEALERKFKTVKALAPDGSVSGLLDAARWPEASEPVLVVGHQPTLGLAAAYLLAGVEVDGANPWRMKKGAVWWLRCRHRGDATHEITLLAVRSPDLL